MRGSSRRILIIALAIITIVLVVVAAVIAARLGQEQTAPVPTGATGCPALPEFGTVQDCVNSCHAGCDGSSFPTECHNGCQSTCENICQGGSNPSTCPNGTCNSPGENHNNCPQDCPATTPTPNLPPSSQCARGNESCESKGCCDGLVCQGVAGSRECEQPIVGNCSQNGGFCGNNYIAFRCDGDFGSECHSNPADFSDINQATTYVNGCGQVDQVWQNGPCHRQLCGTFTIYKNNCNPTTTPPPVVVPPTPSVECGDGTVDPGEQCDDGNNTNGDGCSSTCQVEVTPACGDGQLDTDSGEQCDDGNNIDGDGCSSNCQIETPPSCGDGTIDSGEECDDGNTNDGDGCSALCTVEEAPSCGDGTQDAGEACDDGNNTSGDGCSATCQLESCNNGILDPGESCDPGRTPPGCSSGYTCTSSCTCVTSSLPDTALISDEADRILLGMLLVVGGFLAIRFGTFNFMTPVFGYASTFVNAGSARRHQLAEFEGKVQDTES